MSIYKNLHKKYGSASHVAEFRLFILNNCMKKCDGCFYKRSGNQISTYDKAFDLASELESKKYRMETCYLLPTDFFDNSDNLTLIKEQRVKKILEKFKYIGVATTLEKEIDFAPFAKYLEQCAPKLEVQINLVKNRFFCETYIEEIIKNKKKLSNALEKNRAVFNLALNLGSDFSQDELMRVEELVARLSDDGVIEINFTFLYNKLISKEKKTKKLMNGLRKMNKLGEMYNRIEERYNKRTLLKKPAFFFREDQVYLSPMVPFDEYLFVESPEFSLDEVSFEGFLSTLSHIEKNNHPIDSTCNKCYNLSSCLGKGYFIAANEFGLPCFMEV